MLKKADKIKVGIIGYGGMADWHRRKMRQSGLYEAVAVFDIAESAEKRAEAHNLIVYNSADGLLANPAIEAVLIATPNDVHEFYALKALGSGKHIICEKPVTLSSVSLQKIIDAAIDANKVFTVHQNRRWDKDYLIVKKIHDKALAGNIYKIESNVTGSRGLPGEWRCIRARGGGMLWDWGVHLVDQILCMHAGRVTGVTCRASYVYGYDCDDGVYLTIDFEDGFQANINLDTNKFIRTPRWYVFGLDGTAVIEGWSCRGKIVKAKTFFDKKNKGIQAGNGFTKTMAERSKSTLIIKSLPKVKNYPFEFYKNFYECVRNNAEPIISHKSVMRCMKVLEAAFKSINDKTTIKTNI